MEEVKKFMDECGAWYIATAEGDQPRVRPFGVCAILDGKFYIQTGKVKNVSKQLHANPKLEICGFSKGKVLRLAAVAVEDERVEIKARFLDECPFLKKKYAADDGNTEVFWLKDATAVLSVEGGETKVISFG